MSTKKLQDILVRIFSGPVGGIVLAIFLIAAFFIAINEPLIDIPFVYNQF